MASSFHDRFRDRTEQVARDGSRIPAPAAPGTGNTPQLGPSRATDPPWLAMSGMQEPVPAPAAVRNTGNTFTHAIAAETAVVNPLAGADEVAISVTGRPRHVKPPLPDFKEIALVQFGRRAGQMSLDRPPVLVDHPVSGAYHQHTLKEYRQMLEEYSHHHFGGLGAEDNEEKQRARDAKRKMMQYGDAVTSINVALMDQTGEDWRNRPIERKPRFEALVAMQQKERAKQYAEQWAPAPKAQSTTASPAKSSKAKTPQPSASGGPAALIDQELLSLEEKHKRDLDAIARIKKQLNLA